VLNSKAFTLVELLVVIAIIALLISILAPALSMTRDLAKQLQCMTNLHSIARGISVYAQASRDWVPTFVAKNGQVVPQSVRYFMLAYVYNDGDLVPANLGHLHAQGIIEHPETFYCPYPRYRLGHSSANEYPQPWGQYALGTYYKFEGPGAICTSYSYNPHLELNESPLRVKYRKTEEFPPKAIVTMDGICSGHADYWIVHTIGYWSVNAHYIDGHAENLRWPDGMRYPADLSGNPKAFQDVLAGLEAR